MSTPAWLVWNDGAVPKLARFIQETRDWELLPVLADAMEEAGYPVQQSINHCRDIPVKHHASIRFCGVVDKLVKEASRHA